MPEISDKRGNFPIKLPINYEKVVYLPEIRDDNRRLSIKSFFRLSPLKMDFNQVSARGLKRMMRNVIRRSADKEHVDVVLIGHSKTFVSYNEKTLEPFLRWVSKYV